MLFAYRNEEDLGFESAINWSGFLVGFYVVLLLGSPFKQNLRLSMIQKNVTTMRKIL